MIIVTATLFDDRGNTANTIEPFTIADTAPGDRTSPASNGAAGFAPWPNLPTAITLRTNTTVFDTVNRPTSTTRAWGATPLVTTNTDSKARCD